MAITDYIKQKKNNKFSINGILVTISGSTFMDISDIKQQIEIMNSRVPSFMLAGIKQILIDDYEFLNDKDLQAAYKNSNIYISSRVSNEYQLLSILVHEVAHSVEVKFSKLIYSDKTIEKEFLQKRKMLWQTLKQKGFNIDLNKCLKLDYDHEFDLFLYDTIGYPTLTVLTANIFHSPYAATSLREYFADAFEAFFMKDRIHMIKKISPVVYNKIISLLKLEK